MAFLKIYDVNELPELARVNLSEVKRYAGLMGRNMKDVGETADSFDELIEECIREALPTLSYKVSFLRAPIVWEDGVPKLPFDSHGSHNLAQNLAGCHEVVLFAATVGIGMDRLIARYNRVSPVKALFMQALGAERIESLCDYFNKEIADEAASEGLVTVPRYSPGYGDLPIEVQKVFVVLLDCSRRLGINLNDSLLMSPSKSVTAIIGIKKADGECTEQKESGCSCCTKTDCEYKK